jgi:hypothetical protein
MMHHRIMLVAALAALAGCSSSTEPRSDASADGFELRIDASPNAPVVGDIVTATLTITNTTDATASRTFPPHVDGRPYIDSDPDSPALERSFGDGFGDYLDTGEAYTFSVPAHQSVTVIAHFDAKAAGRSRLTGCLPGRDAATSDGLCVATDVVVRAQ